MLLFLNVYISNLRTVRFKEFLVLSEMTVGNFFVAGPSYCAIGITFFTGAKDTVSRVPIQ